MKAFKKFKITLFLCAATVLLCAAALAGTTYAWFSSSATGSCVIKSGTIEIDVTVYSSASEPNYNDISNLSGGTTLTSYTFGSGYYIVKVENTGSLEAGVIVTANNCAGISELYDSTSSAITLGSGTAYYLSTDGCVYFAISGASSNTTLTVKASNLINKSGSSYTSGGFYYSVTNDNGGD